MATLQRRINSPINTNNPIVDFTSTDSLVSRRVVHSPGGWDGTEVSIYETHTGTDSFSSPNPTPGGDAPFKTQVYSKAYQSQGLDRYRNASGQVPEGSVTGRSRELRGGKYTSSGSKLSSSSKSLISYDGPFANYKFDMLGQVHTRSREEKAMGYKDTWKEGYDAYVSGDLDARGLWNYALRNLPGDQLGTSVETLRDRYRASRPPRVSVRFTRSGGGGYSWTGGGFGY